MSRSTEFAAELSDEQPAIPPNKSPDDDATAPEAMMLFINARLDALLRRPSAELSTADSEAKSEGKNLIGFFIN